MDTKAKIQNLLHDALNIDDANGIQDISIELIEPDPEQPRIRADIDLEALTESIKTEGILSPILIRPVDGAGKIRYRIIAGERRFRAARMAGLKTVPAIVREVDAAKSKEIALIENLHRKQLNPYEEALATLNLLALKSSMTVKEVARALQRFDKQIRQQKARQRGEIDPKTPTGIGDFQLQELECFFRVICGIGWRSFVKSRVPLIYLPEDLQDALRRGRISYTMATLIRTVPDPAVRCMLIEKAADGLPRRQIVALIKSSRESASQDTTVKSQRYRPVFRKLSKWEIPPEREAEIEDLLERLRQLLGVS